MILIVTVYIIHLNHLKYIGASATCLLSLLLYKPFASPRQLPLRTTRLISSATHLNVLLHSLSFQMGTSRGWRITSFFAWVWKESRHLKITLAVTTRVVELLQMFRQSLQNIFMKRDSQRSCLYWRLPVLFSFLLQGFNSSNIITASPPRLERTGAFIILSTGQAQKMETMSLIKKV